MTATDFVKPVDAGWQAAALRFVLRYRERNDRGPTWRELYSHLGWPAHRCAPWHRMQSLAKRGLVWTDESRSLDVTDAGRAALADWHEERRRVRGNPTSTKAG